MKEECEYFNNKRLSEEASYVLNRQKEKKFVGNNLEKPKLFLKSIELRETDQLEEKLAEEGDYSRDKASMKGRFKQSGKFSGLMQKNSDAYFADRHHVQLQSIDFVTSHNNFLAVPPVLVSN